MTFGVIWDCLGYLRFNLSFQLCHNKKMDASYDASIIIINLYFIIHYCLYLRLYSLLSYLLYSYSLSYICNLPKMTKL